MKTKRITFNNADGERLSARIETPVHTHPKAYALFAHCFTCNKNLLAIKNISRALTKAGFAVMRFDFTGLGESEGEFEDTNFSSNVQDLIAAADFLKENFEAPAILIGHSLGGAAVLLAAKYIESVSAIATIGAPAEPLHVAHQFGDNIDKIENQGSAEVNIGGRPFKVKQQFLEDIRGTNLKSVINELRKSILVMHSPQDKIVNINNAADIYTAAFHPKSFISLDGADHLLSNKADSLYAGDVIASWATRYLNITEETPKLRTREQVVVQTGSDKFTTHIKMDEHMITADEPASVGGNDFGPSPYELLLAGLGACTSMTMKMYADRKGWDIDNITVHLSHEKRHGDDYSDSENPTAKIDFIEKSIEIEGDITEKQRQQMFNIAKKCPVHRTLLGDIKIDSSLLE